MISPNKVCGDGPGNVVTTKQNKNKKVHREGGNKDNGPCSSCLKDNYLQSLIPHKPDLRN